MSESLLLKCPVCAADQWQQTYAQWNEWECALCLTQTRLVDGIMDMCPPKNLLLGFDDQKMLRILNCGVETSDALD